VKAGFRWARRDADNTPGLIFADAAVPGTSRPLALPGAVITNPYSDFLGGGTQSLGRLRGRQPRMARDPAAPAFAFGNHRADPSQRQPTGPVAHPRGDARRFILMAG